MTRKKTITLTEAATILGVNERRLRAIRSQDPVILPDAPTEPSGGGRPRKRLYLSDVKAAKAILRGSGALEGSRA